MKLSHQIIFIISFFIFYSSPAQVYKDHELFEDLKKMDSIVFQDGFNLCKLNELENILHPNFEFYHDISGTNGKEQFMKAMKNNICSNPNQKPIRKLVSGTLQVFPLYNQGELYGAIQNGDHEFWIKEPEKELYQTGFARFSTTWLLVDGEWMMKNVLSYDHKAVR